MPTPPPELNTFSSSFYETHTRTADDPARECDWIAEIPSSFNSAIYDYWNETDEWRFDRFDRIQEADKVDDIRAYIVCVEENPDSFPCAEDFWGHTLDVVIEVHDAAYQDSIADADGDESIGGRATLHRTFGVSVAVAIFMLSGAVLYI
ncbi:hypothetical protein IMZ48_08985 [Candidatus Bathyarchaeota archaeon]|nr:hypothetical protein [Candidatus Bathyarchaeota archaeon]